MNVDRQKILVDYTSYLCSTGKSYANIGRYIKYVSLFLEKAESVNRRGYQDYKRKNADMLAQHPVMFDAISDFKIRQ